MAQALIALGSNLGDRAAMLDRAVELLRDTGGLAVLRVSRWYETDAVGGPDGQGPYLNGAALVDTSLDPFALMRALQEIETELGRIRAERWGPRTIDLDLLMYDSLRLEARELTIPHRRMTERRFVLAPATEIAPDMRHPTSGCSVRELLMRLEQRPLVIATVAELQTLVRAERLAGKRIGLVPTMGALHEGHLSLVDAARRECSFTVATIFVNPTQFGPNEDYARYPRTLEQDLALLAARGVDLVFAPQREEMYRPGHATTLTVEGVTTRWEGEFRPGHFAGLATIVLKLFNAALPDVAFFGQKDYQQSVVIRRMIVDLDLPIEIRLCPTVRDADGLALSSRNRYLSADERRRGLSLSQCLRRAAELYRAGQRDADQIAAAMISILSAAPVEIDYAAIVHPDTLELTSVVRPGSVALVAAGVGTTRLLDNQIFE
ncbi:MAG: pantoate--beta-alanine ligase [Pirellulales bacterium]